MCVCSMSFGVVAVVVFVVVVVATDLVVDSKFAIWRLNFCCYQHSSFEFDLVNTGARRFFASDFPYSGATLTFCRVGALLNRVQ